MSNYITKSLEEGESIVLRGHYHWTLTACQVISSCILGLLFVGARGAIYFYPEYATALGWTTWLSLATALLLALWGYILRSHTEFAVTDSRFVQKDGILDIEIKEIPLYKIETINFSQTLLQRIQGTGDIELAGSGGTVHHLTYIAYPMDVKKAIAKAVGKGRQGDSASLSSTMSEERTNGAED